MELIGLIADADWRINVNTTGEDTRHILGRYAVNVLKEDRYFTLYGNTLGHLIDRAAIVTGAADLGELHLVLSGDYYIEGRGWS